MAEKKKIRYFPEEKYEKGLQVLMEPDENGFTLSKADAKKLLEDEGIQPEKGVLDTVGEAAGTALDYGLRGLDYAGGLARGTLGGIAEMTGATDKNIVNIEDVIKGNAPTSAEMMDTAGVGEGGKLSDIVGDWVPEALDVTGRGAAGFLGDTLTDPLTYGTMGLSALGKLGKAGKVASAGVKAQKAIQPTGKGLEKLGRYMYNSGFKNVDNAVSKFTGKKSKAVSETMKKYGVHGSMEGIQKQANSVLDELYLRRKSLMDKLDAGGVQVDVVEGMKKPMETVLAKIDSPILGSDAAKSKELIDLYIAKGGTKDIVTKKRVDTGMTDEIFGGKKYRYDESITPGRPGLSASQASDLKTDLYKKVGSGNYKELAESDIGKQSFQEIASGLKEQVEKAAMDYDPNIGKELKEIHNDMGNLLTGRKSLEQEVGKEIRKDMFSAVDGIAAAASPIVFAAKKGADISKMASFRTTGGTLVEGIGKAGGEVNWMDMMLRNTARDKKGFSDDYGYVNEEK